MASPKQYPSKEYFDSIFEVKKDALYYKIGYNPIKFSGKKAGRVQKAKYKEYHQVKVRGQTYYAHRVIWIMKKGPIPDGLFIDHINGCGTDNSIENLRLVTPIENNRNKRRSSRGSASGYTGVTFDKQAGKWKAHIHVDNLNKNLGLFDCKHEAYRKRRKADVEYGFDASHGASIIPS